MTAETPPQPPPTVHLTDIGGPTLLIEVGGWRLRTDPTFDPPGGRVRVATPRNQHRPGADRRHWR